MYESSPDILSACLSHYIILADVGAAPVAKRPNVQMPDEYLPPNKILFLQNLPETVTKDQLNTLFSQYPNLHEVRLVPSKKDIAFVEYLDEGSATVAKDALHNYKLDGENKIKVRPFYPVLSANDLNPPFPDYFRQEVISWDLRVLAPPLTWNPNSSIIASPSPFLVLSPSTVPCILVIKIMNPDR